MDTCDRCPAPARYRYERGDARLTLCGHHGQEHRQGLRLGGWFTYPDRWDGEGMSDIDIPWVDGAGPQQLGWRPLTLCPDPHKASRLRLVEGDRVGYGDMVLVVTDVVDDVD